jgi:DNA-binding response OmpR family regulator
MTNALTYELDISIMEQTILIVEDNPETLELLRRIVEKDGYKTVLANDGEKGLNYARRYSPDLIVLDRLMPKMNGLQVCKKLKEQDSTSQIPIIFLTILDSETDIIDGLKAGADDYIKKPFSPDELSARIGRILTRYKKSAAPERVDEHLLPYIKKILEAESNIINRFVKNRKLVDLYKKEWRNFFPKIRELDGRNSYGEKKILIEEQIKTIEKGLLLFTRLGKNLSIIQSLILIIYRIEKEFTWEGPTESRIIKDLKREINTIRVVNDKIKQIIDRLNRVLSLINAKYA